MNNFKYLLVSTPTEAVNAVVENAKARFIAGGTNILDLMKENVLAPDHLIDINHLDLNAIEKTAAGGLLLGALTTNAETAYNPLVGAQYPLLRDAILAGASPQLRNMATNGGNLMQRTRCYYFYDTSTPCNKREPGAGCSAIKGFNRIHAILGTSEHCIATHPSDMCVALAALEARVLVIGRGGERVILFSDFHRLPEDTPHLDNTLGDDEIITGIELPPSGFSTYYKYLKVRDRSSYAFALISVAAAFELDNGSISAARLAMGGVAHKPWRVEAAEAFLVGKEPSDGNFGAAADILLNGAKGFGANDFKVELARRAVVKACREAVRRGASV